MVFHKLRVVDLTNNERLTSTSIIPRCEFSKTEETPAEDPDPSYDFSELAQKVAETFELEANSFVMGFFDSILVKDGEFYFETLEPPHYYCKLPLTPLTPLTDAY